MWVSIYHLPFTIYYLPSPGGPFKSGTFAGWEGWFTPASRFKVIQACVMKSLFRQVGLAGGPLGRLLISESKR